MSITRAQAAELVLAAANRMFGYPTEEDELVILDQFVKESDSVWAFVYNTRSSVETGDFMRGLMGNGPILVVKATGHVEPMSSLYNSEQAIEMFETGTCQGMEKITPSELVEIFQAVSQHWPDQEMDEDGLPPRPPQYTPEEWKEYHRDPCAWCIKELRNPDRSIRCNAADILRGLAHDAVAAIPALIEGFHDPDEMVRCYCVHALVDIGHAAKERAAAAVTPLTALLRDANPEIRSLAICALEAIGPAAASAVNELQKLLTDPDSETRERAAGAIDRLRAGNRPK